MLFLVARWDDNLWSNSGIDVDAWMPATSFSPTLQGMDSSQIATRWRMAFGAAPPVAFVCRDALESRWLRIHSLPGSKRYPSNESEYDELLRRHNTVAEAVLGEEAECVLFMASFGSPAMNPIVADLLTAREAAFVPLPELSTAIDGGSESINFAAALVSWRSRRFDSLIRAIADDRSGPVMFANLDRSTAYAPYDGGADLFLASREMAATMTIVWSDWLSSRADGL